MLIGGGKVEEDGEAMWLAAQRGTYDNDIDEEEEEELLRNVPCANDIVPIFEDTAVQPKQSLDDMHNFSDVGASASVQDDLCGVTSSHVSMTRSAFNGVCDFPPLSQVSFMMRGDNGVVRWITALGLDEKSVSRKRKRDIDGTDSNINNTEEEEEEEDMSLTRGVQRRRMDNGLGYVNIPTLLQQLYDEAATIDEGSRTVQPQTLLLPSAQEKRGEGTLWVIKYSPKRFRDLLSDDNINLKLLQWLKSWDAYIFQNTSVKGNGDTNNIGMDKLSSAPVRPEERLAVLVGPPGVGKTTLAHVLAAHCGYETIEINASVDRTISRIESAIQLAVAPTRRRRRVPPSSSSLSHEENAKGTSNGEVSVSLVDALLRPKCLIIDEMDGISANVAALLLQQDIHCPVFCLCNDYYVPSLRDLRRRCQHVYYFQPIRPQRLLSRLTEIAEREGMSVSQSVLAELVQSSNGDVRSCLNTLQFFYRHVSQSGGSKETMQLIREMQGKDAKLGLWDSWRTVFERQERSKYIQLLRKEYGIEYETALTAGSFKRSTKQMAQDESYSHLNTRQQQQQYREERDNLALGFRVDPGYVYVSRMLEQCTDINTLLDGIQEYYLQRSYADYSLHRTRDMSNAFSFQDNLTTCSYRDAASSTLIPFVNTYASTTAASCFSFCSSSLRGNVSMGFPRELAGASRRLAESMHIAHTFRDGCRGETAAHLCSVDVVSQEFIPFLLRCLLDASLRIPAYSVVSMSALSPQDQKLLLASAICHAEYGLTYARSLSAPRMTSSAFSSSAMGEEGEEDDKLQEQWELTPPIHRIGCVTIGAMGLKSAQRTHLATPSGGTSAIFSSSLTSAELIPVLRMKEDIRQLMIGEIQRVVIQNTSVRIAKNSGNTNNLWNKTIMDKKLEQEKGEKLAPVPLLRKRVREKKEEGTDEGERTDDGTTLIKMNGAAVSSQSIALSTSTATASVTMSKSKLGGKRDFFGRLIPESTAISSSSSSSSTLTTTTKTIACQKRTGTRLTVQYTYHDGSTNAVKIPAVFADF